MFLVMFKTVANKLIPRSSTYCVLRIAYCVLGIAYWVLRIAYCVLGIAYCGLRIADCGLPNRAIYLFLFD